MQTLMLARAGAVVGQKYVNENNNDFLQDVQEAMSLATAGATGPWYFSDESAGTTPKAGSVGNNRDMKALLGQLQTRLDTAFCGQAVAPTGSRGELSLRVHVDAGATVCGESLPNRTKLPSPRFVSGGPRDASGATGLQVYAVPYVLVATGAQGEYERQMVVQGELHITAGSSSFARYAYFTNRDAESDLWFNTNTLIDGPVHTNSNFRFDGTPWFGGDVTSAGCRNTVDLNACSGQIAGATFDTDSRVFIAPGAMGDDQAPTEDNTAPTFAGPSGVAWNAAHIPLPPNTISQRNAARGKRSDGTSDAPTQGILLGTAGTCASSAEHCSLRVWGTNNPAATDRDPAPLVYDGDDADGAPQWTEASTHQYIEWCPTAALPPAAVPPAATDCVTYRTFVDSSSGETVLERFNGTSFDKDLDGNGTVEGKESRPFNGVIYSDVAVQRLTGKARTDPDNPKTAPPAIAKFSQLTVASSEAIRMTGDLKYEEPPHTGIATRNADDSVTPAGDINDGASNILGIYSEQDLLIGHGNGGDLDAPDNVMVNASLMSGKGSITVENFDNGASSGNFQLIGGMIQTERGPFGTFSGDTHTSGFARTYTYDERFLAGLAPPFFPTTADQSGKTLFRFTFGVREQSN